MPKKAHKQKTPHSSNILSSQSDTEEFDKYDRKNKITEHDQVSDSVEFDSDHDAPDVNASTESDSESDSGSGSGSESESVDTSPKHKKSKSKSKNDLREATQLLKSHIEVWLECDTRIKEMNALIKEQKDIKKKKERVALGMIAKLDMEGVKLDITDKKGKVVARVYKHKSVTKSAIKEDLLKDTLMEIFQNEKKVDQIVKKVDSKRRINERFYLKRTKGEGNAKK